MEQILNAPNQTPKPKSKRASFRLGIAVAGAEVALGDLKVKQDLDDVDAWRR